MGTQPEVAPGGAIGRYIVLGLVGRGAMGEVYAAYDPQLDRKVAVKLLRAGTSPTGGAAEAKTRLLREAQSMAKLSHPNVIVVHDVGSHGDQVFVAMDFVDGHTITYWLHARARTWQEILRVFLPAGRGLAAAHAANLVHRDFKAENVMLGHDGQVRVMDFGLARQLATGSSGWTTSGQRPVVSPVAAVLPAPDEQDVGATRELPAQKRTALGGFVAPGSGGMSPAAILAASPSELDQLSLTRSGHVMGTPAYMSPELFRGEMADARSDQFSFSVAVYEALYGTHPFGGQTLEQLINNVLRGQVRAAPESTRVPGWVRRVLLRGLQTDPDLRWPSMDAMLAALSHNPRLRPLQYLAGGAVVISIVLAAALGRQTSGKPICVMPAERFIGVWEPAGRGGRREAVGKAMHATGKAYADVSFAALSRLLDRYVQAWAGMYRDACEATNVRRDQSAEVLDLRVSCLRDRWNELRALSDVLVEGQGVAVTNAVAAATALTPIERCADVGGLRVGLALPVDPTTRQKVSVLRNQLVEITAQQNAGHYSRGLDMAARTLADARTVGYRPVVAEAQYRFARLQLDTGQVTAGSENLEQAMWTAQALGHDELAAEVAVQFIHVAGYLHHDMPQARRWMSQAQALLERIGGHDQLRAWMLNNFANALYFAGKDEEAVGQLLTALRIKERLLGKDHPDVAYTLGNLADELRNLGRPLEALEFSNRGVDIIEHAFGPWHSDMAIQLTNRAEILLLLGRHQEARQDAERSVTIEEREMGPSSVNLVSALTPLAESEIGLQTPVLAVRHLERALELAQGAGETTELPRIRFALARALWESGHEQKRALRMAALASRATGRAVSPLQERIQRRAAAWLASHNRSGRRH